MQGGQNKGLKIIQGMKEYRVSKSAGYAIIHGDEKTQGSARPCAKIYGTKID
jgi:hypothetical protein